MSEREAERKKENSEEQRKRKKQSEIDGNFYLEIRVGSVTQIDVLR